MSEHGEERSPSSVIELRGIGKVYGRGRRRVQALDAIDLQVKKGRVCGLLGPNGAGKTTMIKIILGLQAPSAGEMNVLGAKRVTRELKEVIGLLS